MVFFNYLYSQFFVALIIELFFPLGFHKWPSTPCLSFVFSLSLLCVCTYSLFLCLCLLLFSLPFFFCSCGTLSIYRKIPKKLFPYFLSTDQLMEQFASVFLSTTPNFVFSRAPLFPFFRLLAGYSTSFEVWGFVSILFWFFFFFFDSCQFPYFKVICCNSNQPFPRYFLSFLFFFFFSCCIPSLFFIVVVRVARDILFNHTSHPSTSYHFFFFKGTYFGPP